MFGTKKKPKLGFKSKVRTQSEVEKAYAFHAFEIGHKMLRCKEAQAIADRLQDDIEDHIKELETIQSEKFTKSEESDRPKDPATQAVTENQAGNA